MDQRHRQSGDLVDPMSPHGVHSALQVPADLQVVAFVRCALACVLEREGWPADGAGRVLLASTEALTNAIEHGSPLYGRVDVALTVGPERAQVSVVDEGRPGVPVPVCPSDPPPTTSTRGRGLLIISRLADDFDVRPAGDGTQVSVGFWRHSAAGDAELAALAGRAAA
jgi:anti-sigma regulatory factor (Ser/Thr protein kinase)